MIGDREKTRRGLFVLFVAIGILWVFAIVAQEEATTDQNITDATAGKEDVPTQPPEITAPIETNHPNEAQPSEPIQPATSAQEKAASSIETEKTAKDAAATTEVTTTPTTTQDTPEENKEKQEQKTEEVSSLTTETAGEQPATAKEEGTKAAEEKMIATEPAKDEEKAIAIAEEKKREINEEKKEIKEETKEAENKTLETIGEKRNGDIQEPPPSSAAIETPPASKETFELERTIKADVEPTAHPKEKKKIEKIEPTTKEEETKARKEKPSFFQRLFSRKAKEVKEIDQPSKQEDTSQIKPAQETPSASTSLVAEAKPAPVVEKPKEPPREPTEEERLAMQEEIRLQAKEVEGLKLINQAQEAMLKNEFQEAVSLYNKALELMPRRPRTVEVREQANIARSECEYRIALDLAKRGATPENLEEARKWIEQSLIHNSMNQKAVRLKEQIDRDLKKAKAAPPPVKSLREEPEYASYKAKIRQTMDKGRQWMILKEWDKASEYFKEVLAMDPKNTEAAANLKKIAEEQYQQETDQFNRFKEEVMAQVRDTWTPPVKPSKKAKSMAVTGTTEVKGTESELKRRQLMDKLKQIEITDINWDNARLQDVVRFLMEESKIRDPEKQGVNIILKLPSSTQTQPAEGGVEALTAAYQPPTVTLQAIRPMTLMEIIEHISDVTGMKYRITENRVVIYPANMPYGDMITVSRRVQKSVIDSILAGAGAAESAGGGTGLETMPLGGAQPAAGGAPEHLGIKNFFINAGVQFPVGSSITYNAALGLLIVKNTVENIDDFDRILRLIDKPPLQVEIEARFVEINQTDLEELGLEWLLTDNWEIAENKSSSPLPAGRERIQVNKNTFTKGLRNLDKSSGGIVATPGGGMAGIFSISSILTNPELSVILHALQQKTGNNLLSAPKVTTRNGQNAEIKVVHELIYPTEFEQNVQSVGTTTSSGGSTGNQQLTRVVITPGGFQTRDTGVVLSCMPTVGSDFYTIDLELNPQVVELAEWIDYGYDVPTEGGSMPQHITMRQPIFHTRQITTKIQVYDGQTVVMGGLIKEDQQTTEDKIPILGDIPLVGYLFRSKTTQSIKKNLLIFVTARLVDPAGNKIEQPEVTAGESAAVNTGS